MLPARRAPTVPRCPPFSHTPQPHPRPARTAVMVHHQRRTAPWRRSRHGSHRRRTGFEGDHGGSRSQARRTKKQTCFSTAVFCSMQEPTFFFQTAASGVEGHLPPRAVAPAASCSPFGNVLWKSCLARLHVEVNTHSASPPRAFCRNACASFFLSLPGTTRSTSRRWPFTEKGPPTRTPGRERKSCTTPSSLMSEKRIVIPRSGARIASVKLGVISSTVTPPPPMTMS